MRLWPQSLASRVFLLYGLTICAAALCGLSLLMHQELGRHIDESQENVQKMANLAERALAESAVIGDFDTIKRTLERMVPNSALEQAVYSDRAGGVIAVGANSPERAPQWLSAFVDVRLPQVQRVIAVGGREYGELRLDFDARKVSGQLWAFMVQTAVLTALGLVFGLLLMRLLLRRWLGNLQRLEHYQAEVLSGELDARATVPADAPLEMRQAIEVINRTAGSLRAQFGQRIDVLMQALIQHKKAMDEAAIVCELDLQGRITYANEHYIRATGVPRERLLGLELVRLGTNDGTEQPPWTPDADIWHGDVVLRQPDGRIRYHRRSIVPQLDLHGQVEKYICIDIDITAQKHSQENLRDQVRRQRLLADFGRQAMDSLDVEDLMTRAVATAQAGLQTSHSALLMDAPGYDGPRLVAGQGWEAQWLGHELPRIVDAPGLGAAKDLSLPQALLNAHGICSLSSVHGESASGHRFQIWVGDTDLRVFAATDEDFLRSIAHVLAAAIERHESREHLTRLARFDQLTGLPNRGLLHDRLQVALRAAKRRKHRLCLIYLDLDRFKQVNDTLGHEAGDQLLVQAAQRMLTCLRDGDTVARLSGDEFAVLLPEISQAGDAELVGQKLLLELSRPFALGGQETFISASLGAALFPDDGLDAETLLREADQAMYHSKRAGRNQFFFFESEMSDQTSERLAYEGLLRGALARHEFFVLYQPKVSLETGRICGLEALLRWNHPTKGVLGPSEFVSRLEETGLVLEVGRWVLRSVAEQIVDWQGSGLTVPRVSINLSARQFSSGTLLEDVRGLIAELGLEPGLLEFEITESMLMQDPAQAAVALGNLRAAGVAISVDDFGTGYSSLSYLHRFPLDAVKVDRTFVHDLTSNAENASITWAIINLAHMLKLKVVAEGVESQAQVDLLAAHGCDEVQGYYFSRPVNAADCAVMLREQRRLVWSGTGEDSGEGQWRRASAALA